jgi:hypothetical protein
MLQFVADPEQHAPIGGPPRGAPASEPEVIDVRAFFRGSLKRSPSFVTALICGPDFPQNGGSKTSKTGAFVAAAPFVELVVSPKTDSPCARPIDAQISMVRIIRGTSDHHWLDY